MTPGSLMLIAGIILAISAIVLVFNFARAAQTMKLDGLTMLLHLLSSFAVAGSGLAFIGGFIWFLVDKYAK